VKNGAASIEEALTMGVNNMVAVIAPSRRARVID
jgi:hypothetical protein